VRERERKSAIKLDSLPAAYIQFMIMLIELQKVLSQELKCLCSKTTTVYCNEPYQNYGRVSYIFTAIQLNKNTVQKCINSRVSFYDGVTFSNIWL